jgi:hypothetical protein
MLIQKFWDLPIQYEIIVSAFFLAALISAALGLSFVTTLSPQISKQQVQFIVPEENWQAFDNMSIEMEKDSQRTIPITLINMTEGA